MDYLKPHKDGRWIVRVIVPPRLHKIVGQKQFERSVDRVDAALLALEVSNVTISEDALALLDSTEPGAAAARLRELADLIEHCGAYVPPKHRIRVRATTRREAA